MRASAPETGGSPRSGRPELVVQPGWPAALLTLTMAGITGGLVHRWSEGADWLIDRAVLGGLALVVVGLLIGWSGMVGLAALPMLGGAVIGLARPAGHAWGQALLIGILWYVATEAAWASIEARQGTVRTPAVTRLRLREVAATVATAVVVGLAGAGLASLTPTRTATIKAIAIAGILIGLAALGRHLTTMASSPARQDPREPSPGG